MLLCSYVLAADGHDRSHFCFSPLRHNSPRPFAVNPLLRRAGPCGGAAAAWRHARERPHAPHVAAMPSDEAWESALQLGAAVAEALGSAVFAGDDGPQRAALVVGKRSLTSPAAVHVAAAAPAARVLTLARRRPAQTAWPARAWRPCRRKRRSG